MQVKGVELLFLHEQFVAVAAGAGDQEALAAGQGDDVGAGVVLRQLQAPALAEPRVEGVERVVRQAQGQLRAGQVVAVQLRQRQAAGVLAGARIDATLDETEEVERIGMNAR
ncbi:MAG TPA: hypothetical protein DIT18_02725 [Pseudomonas sp.]|nr:hypothetical protein [Pseudomonas sp.]